MKPKNSVVNGSKIEWTNGLEVYKTMEPGFRENLGGDISRVEDLLSKYWIRGLWLDEESSRRIDHVRTDPGYIDLSEAYHGSVEESYFLSGEVDLTAEGKFLAGDYFWRPPGWVHSAATDVGFEAILMMEGESPLDGSGRVSRVVRADDEAGKNPLLSGTEAIGPRGYVRRAETRYMVWRTKSGSEYCIDGDKISTKVLSENAYTGAASVLLKFSKGHELSLQECARERFLILTKGSVEVDGESLAESSLIHLPAGGDPLKINCLSEAEFLLKIGKHHDG